MSGPHVISVNIGPVRPLATAHGTVPSGIVKEAVRVPVRAERLGLAGDEQADHDSHGGAPKAVYAYATEDLAWWSHELDRELPPGLFGENLTTAGLDLGAARIGDRWLVGSAELRVTQPRLPCYKFAARMNDPRFPRRFAKALRTGLYLAITISGEITTGDTIAVAPRREGATIRHVAGELLNVPLR